MQRIISALNLGSSGFDTSPISSDQQSTPGPSGRKRRMPTAIDEVMYPGGKCPQFNGNLFVCSNIRSSTYGKSHNHYTSRKKIKNKRSSNGTATLVEKVVKQGIEM